MAGELKNYGFIGNKNCRGNPNLKECDKVSFSKRTLLDVPRDKTFGQR